MDGSQLTALLAHAGSSFDAELSLDHELEAATSWHVHEQPGEPTFEALRDDVPSALWSRIAWLPEQIAG